MNKKLHSSHWLISGVFLSFLALFIPAVSANPDNSSPPAAHQEIQQFLDSVILTAHPYQFDHNNDGKIDMTIYPLKTTSPDLASTYTTIDQAIGQQRFVFREDPRNYRPSLKRPNFNENTAVYGPSRGNPGNYGPGIVGQSFGRSRTFYQSGQMFRGGGQNRGIGGGGVLGGSRDRRYRNQGGYQGSRTYGRTRDSGPYRYRNRPSYSRRSSPNNSLSAPTGRAREFEMDVFCFEKNRPIVQSIRSGSPKEFTYGGMASPTLRKQLILTNRQPDIHRIIAAELKRLGITSRSEAFTDILHQPEIQQTIDYYVLHTAKILRENEEITGMIIARGDGEILCGDVYASSDLFTKMFPHLIQSAALDVYLPRKTRRYIPKNNAENFLKTMTQPQTWQPQTFQTFRLISPEMVGEIVVDTEADIPTIVHFEAYPR